MHIDTDESNAVMATPGMMVEVIKQYGVTYDGFISVALGCGIFIN